jgi:enterochelin esterase family protein
MIAIEQLRHDLATDPGALDAFFDAHEFPIVEGRQVTFVYRGPAQGVFLQHWIKALPQQQPFQRLGATDVWYLTMNLPRNSRIEYKLGVEQGGAMGMYGHGHMHHHGQGPQGQLIRDPLNPHHALDPFGANSVVHTEGHQEPDWTQPDEWARLGELQQHTIRSAAFGERRELQVYVPARYRPRRRYPLLVVHDGDDFLRFANLKVVLDNLIHRLEIAPMVVALTQSPDRLREYAASEAHGRFIAEELVPQLEQELPLEARPESRGLLGASFGAVASLSTAWRHQGVFGRLGLLSGSFAFTDIGKSERGPAFAPVVDFVNAFRADPGRPASKLFVSCGVYESLIYENRSLVPLLQASGMDVRYVEVRDGHNWENWRDRMREGLSWLFPGPLWMVYE